jgi:post-segregation antitoxin (ccd killing protein)
MPKVNIYLPDDLADEARTAKLSLSSICQRAIRDELDMVKAKDASTGHLEAVAARLRSTIDEEDTQKRAEGHEDGVTWAREWATARELEEIAGPWDGTMVFDGDHTLVGFMSAKNGQNYVEIRIDNDDPATNSYWDGFSDGATEVYEAVQPLLWRNPVVRRMAAISATGRHRKKSG